MDRKNTILAAGVPAIRVADCAHNAAAIIELMREAAERGAGVLVFPELCITGATCGDLFWQETLLDGAWEGLQQIAEASANLSLLTVVGLPMRGEGGIYNCAALVMGGEALAFVPKWGLSVEERRWFTPGDGDERDFRCSLLPGRSIRVAFGGEDPREADLILSPAADAEWSGRGGERRREAERISREAGAVFIRATAGEGESTTDLVFGGHCLIARGGCVEAERRFACGLTLWEGEVGGLTPCTLPPEERSFLLSDAPFLPREEEGLEEILTLAALGLKKRLEHTRASAAVIGLSGGLDSTLAILTAVRAFDLLGLDRKGILAVTMPCFGTTSRTRSNAEKLALALGTELRVVDISAAVRQHLADIGHSEEDHSVTYENAQARERTQVLMDLSNKVGGPVIGTGDLSELALGWCTYNGDHMSMYAVNSGIPKTIMRHLTAYEAERLGGELAAVLRDILDTPVSPELLPPKDGEIAQRTEDLVGPYEIHDFYLYYAVGEGLRPRRVLELAERALGDRYDRDTLLKWLVSFYRRFFAQQFKRSCMPDGPRVIRLSLSPRGGWQMPSDGVAALWLKELEELK